MSKQNLMKSIDFDERLKQIFIPLLEEGMRHTAIAERLCDKIDESTKKINEITNRKIHEQFQFSGKSYP